MISFVIPAIWLAWVLGFPGIRTETRAAKNALVWWYPTQSKRGNFPPAQRIHEGGGFRFGGLLALPLLVGLALIFGTPEVQVAPKAVGYPPEAMLIPQALLSLFAVAGVFQITRKWIDIAEHGAEILAAEDEGVENYRAAEIAKRLLCTEWRSRIILLLGRW